MIDAEICEPAALDPPVPTNADAGGKEEREPPVPSTVQPDAAPAASRTSIIEKRMAPRSKPTLAHRQIL